MLTIETLVEYFRKKIPTSRINIGVAAKSLAIFENGKEILVINFDREYPWGTDIEKEVILDYIERVLEDNKNGREETGQGGTQCGDSSSSM